jgi:hypothetical protein
MQDTQQLDKLRAFVEHIARMTTPDLEALSNDDAYEKARDLADLIDEAHELMRALL